MFEAPSCKFAIFRHPVMSHSVQALSKPCPSCVQARPMSVQVRHDTQLGIQVFATFGGLRVPPHPGIQVFVTFGGMRVSQIPVQSCPILSKRSPSPVQAVTKPPPISCQVLGKRLASAWQALGKQWASPPLFLASPPFSIDRNISFCILSGICDSAQAPLL